MTNTSGTRPPTLKTIVSKLSVCFVPKADSRVYSSPIASNKSAGTFAGTLKIEKT